jgi:hypothetical protein
MSFRKPFITFAALLLASATAVAQQTAPTSAPGDAQSLTVRIAEVRGLVRVRSAPDQPWQKAAVGMELPQGAEFQTGPKSACVCTIENDQTIVIDRLGVVSVAQAIKSSGTVKTDLLMKYGRTEYEIESAGAKHDATIRSPSSTLAVRGTRVNLYDQPPFSPSAQSYTGRAIYSYAKRRTALGAPGRGAVVQASRGTAAESALGETVVDPSIGQARTSADAKLIETEVSRGALADFNERTGITVFKNGAGPPGDDELNRFLPGKFNVIARWTGNQDLNLVVDPEFFPADQILSKVGSFADKGPDEILFPGFGQNISATGGRIDFDHRGGPKGGYEVAHYEKPKSGIYGIIVLPGGHGGTEPANVKIQAFLEGKSIDLVFPLLDEQGNIVVGADGLPQLDIQKTIERVVTPDQTDVAGLTFVPSLEQLQGASSTGGSSDNRAADKRAARHAQLEQRRAEKQAKKASQIDRKRGVSTVNVPKK